MDHRTTNSPAMRDANNQCFYSLRDDNKLICILDKGCQHASVLKAIMKMWTSQF